MERSVRIVLVSDGTGSHPSSRRYPAERLRACVKRSWRSRRHPRPAGTSHRLACACPTGRCRSAGPEFERAVTSVRAAARDSGAGSVFVTWRHDPHCDHQAAFAIARAAVAGLEGVRLYAYPVWGWTLADETAARRAGAQGRPARHRSLSGPQAPRDPGAPVADDGPDRRRSASVSGCDRPCWRNSTTPHEIFLEMRALSRARQFVAGRLFRGALSPGCATRGALPAATTSARNMRRPSRRCHCRPIATGSRSAARSAC